MEKSLYICNATNLECEVYTYRNTALSVSSCCTSAPRSRGFVAKLFKGVRSLFVHTKRKTCSTMRQTDKQATKAKNSNLYAHITDILVALSAIVIGSLLLIYAPDILMVIGKFLACVALVAMVVVPAIYAFTWKPSKPYEKY